MTSDHKLRLRVVRNGPYTKANRKQLRHHVAVGAGLGSAAGAAGGAHLGAHMHGSELKRIVAGSSHNPRIGTRGRFAAGGALVIGALGAVAGANAGQNVARAQRHQAARKLSKAVGADYRQLVADRDRRRAAKNAARPRKPYFNPSPEQQAGSAARRAAQASEKAGRQFRRVPVHGYTLGEHIHAGQVKNAAAAAGLLVGGAALIHHDRKQLAKADHVKRDTAAGAAVGVGAVDLASVVGGQTTKAVLKERRASRGESPHEARIWSAHKKKYGVTGRAGGSIPNSAKQKVYRNYPKGLSDWRAQRALAVKNSNKFVAGSLAAGAITGAAIAHHRAQKPIAKADRRGKTEEAGAAAVGAGAAQGGYQGAGYSTKHWVDRHTRKGGRSVTAEQVKLQDKALKANKKRFGMHLPHGSAARDNVGYHRTYPRQLPHSGKIRALGYTHEGKIGVATGATLTAIGGVGALAAMHHHVNKSEPRRKRPTAAERKAYFAAHDAHDAHIARHRAERDDWDRAEWRSHLAFLQDHGPSIETRFHPTLKPKRKPKRKPIAKSEPLAIAGKLWRKPTVRSEFVRAFTGTRKGEKIVDRAARTPQMRHYRDRYGYPRSVRSGESMRAPARAALHARTATAASYSPHKTGFNAGVKAGRAVASAGRHPEYAISVPAVGAGAGLAHHEIKRSKKKGTEVAKSAFGVELEKADTRKGSAGKGAAIGGVTAVGGAQAVGSVRGHRIYRHYSPYREMGAGARLKVHASGLRRSFSEPRYLRIHGENALTGAAIGAGIGALAHRKKKGQVEKYQPGTITYHQQEANLHGRKKNSGRTQAAVGAGAAGGGVALHHNAKRIALKVGDRTNSPMFAEQGMYSMRAAQNAGRTYTAARRGGAGLVVGGGALAAVGVGRAIHHGHAQNVESKRAQAARRDRNAELEVAKLGPPKVTYREAHVTRRNEKKNKTTHYGPRRIHTERTGKTLILRRKKYHAGAGPTVKPKDGDLVSVSPKMVVSWKDGRRLAHAHETDAKHVTLSSGHTIKHRSIRGDTMSKSAFGVEDHRLEKNILTEGFSAGMGLLRGFKGGMTGAVGAERTAAGATGKIAGAKTMGKLKPIGAAVTKTPARAAATAGLGGLGVGIATNNRNR